MYWLVYQPLIEKEQYNPEIMSNNITLSVAIRKIEAETKEEAIGKFMLDTAELKFTKRVDPLTCFEFDTLKTI